MFKKLMAGVMLAALAVTAIAPATVSAAPTKDIPNKLLALNARTGSFDTLIAAATCEEFRSDAGNPLSSAVIAALAGLDGGVLYAPTDFAFKRTLGLNASNICTAVDPETVLLPILLDHVTADRDTFKSLRREARRGGTIETLGGPVDVNAKYGKRLRPALGDTNAFIKEQRYASNGVIRVVTRVIVQS